MTEKENNTTTAGSPRVPQRRSDGTAGPSPEVSQRDHMPSGTGGAGWEDEELAWARRNVPDDDPTIPPEQGAHRQMPGLRPVRSGAGA